MGAEPLAFLFTLLTPLKKRERNVVCLTATWKDLESILLLQGEGVGLEGWVGEDSPPDIAKDVGDPNSVLGICFSAPHGA